MVLSILFTPLGRYAAIAIVAFMLIAYGIHSIKKQAIAEVEAAAVADALRRTQDAVRAGDAVDVTPDGLLKSDGHRRN
jgi:ABC-type branched-subunit amino acid transport system substrate-binding protein